MPFLVEVLIGVSVAIAASAFAAVRSHYASRERPDSRWLRVRTHGLFYTGPVLGSFLVGVLVHAPIGLGIRGIDGYAPAYFVAVPIVFALLAGGWNLAEWLHNRRPATSPLPIARAVTLPPREPDDAGHWCPVCKGPHVTYCTAGDSDCPECGARNSCGVSGPHHAWHCSGYQCETCGRIGKGLHVDENWAAHVCPADAGGDALHGWCVCGEHTEYLKERAA